MAILRFTDGENFDMSGPLRVIHRKDGWYVIGEGMMWPVNTREEGERDIRELRHKL